VSAERHSSSSAGDDWGLYRELAEVAVPRRTEQAAALLTLLPFAATDGFVAVDMGCGEGALTAALLDAFPRARAVALDGDEAMLAIAGRRLQVYGARVSVERFELGSTEWLVHAEGAGAVLSSLCVHHLDDDGKRGLFRALRARITSPGALLIADLVEPGRPEARALYASAYDRRAHTQSLAAAGGEDLYRRFLEARWNYYRYPDETDRPSRLFDQLRWMEHAGFEDVDCFWLDAGHAIYGGYASAGSGGLSPAEAEAAAERAFSAPL
jgi:tRNA (cmo5U34)-methyltransferase